MSVTAHGRTRGDAGAMGRLPMLASPLAALLFVLAHLAAGARAVFMAHGVSKAFADRFMISGTVVAAIIATWIMLGMSGMRVHFV